MIVVSLSLVKHYLSRTAGASSQWILISIAYSQLAVMEKDKLHVLEQGLDSTTEFNMGNLCHMENLEVKNQ